ncbi:hypothetical protein D9758_007586 [Tetrapyrgos nigripes]|uniref:ceramidase n=1 Tax=Tetrapyrgos nigripes TaxID=182062 RepID=A0A8H5LJW8_9AGAR|nr:hypothetical protein D9758_007586 [Tetrapyrgos nigripes]
MAPVTRSQTSASSTLLRIRNSSEPPVYRLDLSLPPRKRHSEICRDFKQHLQDLCPLYDEVMAQTPFPHLNKFLARLLLTRVYSKEETEEIRGISLDAGIPKHMVVALNTFLDLLSSCLSGGVQVDDSGPSGRSTGIVHFRNLDWGMDVLRRLTICLEYVRNGAVIARAVTYAGYVGVLTGVRQGLSVSYNYRPHFNPTVSKIRHYFHQTMLILGTRPSASSRLRSILLSPTQSPSSWTPLSINAQVNKYPSCPCYLTFCTLDTHNTRKGFMEGWTREQWEELYQKYQKRESSSNPESLAPREIIEDSMERHACVCRLWEGTQSRSQSQTGTKTRVQKHNKTTEIIDWLQTRPLLNECTHYSCIMDPSVEGGGLIWVKRYVEPVDMVEDVNEETDEGEGMSDSGDVSGSLDSDA